MTVLQEYDDIMTVEDACEVLGIGRNNMYKILGSGKLKAFKNGRAWCIPKYEVIRFIESQTAITNTSVKDTEEENNMCNENVVKDFVNFDYTDDEYQCVTESTDSFIDRFNRLFEPISENRVRNVEKQPKMRQLLTEDEITMLENKENYLFINEIEFVASKCTHRKDGKSVLTQAIDGSVYCPICKQTFTMMDSYSKEDIESLSNALIDLLQSIKAMDLDISDSAGEFMKIIPVLKRIPEMYVNALNTLEQYDYQKF